MTDELGFDDVFGVQGDPTVVEGPTYKTYENGSYRIKGIHSFVTKDKDRDMPIFVPQGDSLVVRFKTLVLETRSTDNQTVEVEVEGPPMSATLLQMRLLAQAFGVSLTSLPDEATSKFLLDVQDAIGRSGKVRIGEITRGKGWIDKVDGMTPPTDQAYTWELTGFRSRDNTTPVRFQKKDNGNYEDDIAYADFVIVGNAYGLDSAYIGYRISVKVENPFDGGMITTRSGSLGPSTAIGAKGGEPIAVTRFRELSRAFCPVEFFKHVWVEDAERSTLGINEFENPLAVIDSYVRKAKRRAIAKILTKKTGFLTLDLQSFIPTMTTGTPEVVEPAQPSELEAFYDYVVKKYGKDIFAPTDKNADTINLSLTPNGRDWAKKTLVPIWDELGLPIENGSRFIAKLNPEQLVSLTNKLREANGDKPDLTHAEGIDSF